MQGINKFIGIGTLGHDINLRTTTQGIVTTSFNLAINEKRKIKDSWVEDTEWVRIFACGYIAEALSRYAKKGSNIYVEGRLKTTKWKNKEGITKWSTEIMAEKVRFLSPPSHKQDCSSFCDKNRDDVPF